MKSIFEPVMTAMTTREETKKRCEEIFLCGLKWYYFFAGTTTEYGLSYIVR